MGDVFLLTQRLAKCKCFQSINLTAYEKLQRSVFDRLYDEGVRKDIFILNI